MRKHFAVFLLIILGFLITVTGIESQAKHIDGHQERVHKSFSSISAQEVLNQVEDAVPHHHSLKGRLERNKYFSSVSERLSGNGLKHSASQQYSNLFISNYSSRLFYQYKDTLFSFLQGLLFPNHFFW